MIEHPILFSGAMVRAILEGRKTMTRRIVKWPVSDRHQDTSHYPMISKNGLWWSPSEICPYGHPGDRLWVRETWKNSLHSDGYNTDGSEKVHDCPAYRADLRYACGKKAIDKNWRPSIFMPRWASRITLEIMAIRVERVQDISEEDAKAEGAEAEFETDLATFMKKGTDFDSISTYRIGFKHLWDSINAKRGYGWDTNPWAWVIEFKKS